MKFDLHLKEVSNDLKMDFGEVSEVTSTTNYEFLKNKPSINSVELVGNRSLGDIGIQAVSNMELFELLK